MADSLKIAIVGGGIMGCTLANGLLRYSHIDWQLYEGKTSFVERGAAVGFRDNGTKALAALGMDYQGMYRRSGAAVSDGSHDIVAYGEHKGKTVSKLPAGHINIMRTRWLDELLAPLPKERLHTGKKLISIDAPTSSGGIYTLTFQDGTSTTAHAVIGCDGIHSIVRSIVLSEHPKSIPPRFGGYWDARGITTPSEAAKRFGTDLFDPLKSTEIALTGEGAFMLFCPSESGSEYTVIVSAVAAPDFDTTAWKTPLNREFLENAFKGFESGFRDAVIDCIMADDMGAVFSQWMTPETPTYFRRPGLCIAGDSAHSMLPFYGNGAALSMEDAAVLSTLLGCCEKVDDIASALEAFDWAQRERGEEMVKNSQIAAKLMTGQFGLDPEGFKHLDADQWWIDIIETDVQGNVERAVARFNDLRGR